MLAQAALAVHYNNLLVLTECRFMSCKKIKLSKLASIFSLTCFTLPLVSYAELEEVTITAEKFESTLQETPLSVLAFSDEQIDNLNVTDLQDMQNFLPNVSIGGQVAAGGSYPNTVIRGIGQATARVNNDRGVALYVDDMFYPRSTGSLLKLLDVDRLEVLRGPQGTLFGRNATGGAIRYITKKPEAEFGGRIRTTVGSFARKDVDGLINIPFSDQLLGRFQAGYSDRDGFIDEVDVYGDKIGEAGGQEDWAVRGVLRFLPTDDLTVDFSASYTSVNADPSPYLATEVDALPTAGPIGTAARVRDYYFLNVLGQGSQVANDPRLLSPDDETFPWVCFLDDPAISNPAVIGDTLGKTTPRNESLCDRSSEDENAFFNVDTNLTLNDNLSLRSITGYQDLSTENGTSLFGDGVVRRFFIDTEVFTQEFQLNFTSENLNGVAGIYYYDEKVDRLDQQNVAAGGGPFVGQCCSFIDDIFVQDVQSLAVFGSGTLSVTEALQLTLGLRYSDEKKDIDVTDTGGSGVTPVNIKADDSWDSFDYRFAADFKINDDVMVFGSVSTGFKSGGFGADIVAFEPFSVAPGGSRPGTPQTPVVPSYDQEDVINYEIGIRSEFFDNRLRANLTGFLTNYDNMIIQVPEFSTPPGPPQLLQDNGADVEFKGVEVELLFSVNDAMTLSANYGYLDHEIERVIQPIGQGLILDRGSCADTSDPLGAGCALRPLPRAPQNSFTLGANYVMPLSDGSELAFNTNYAWTDELSTGTSSNSIIVDSYGILNLRATWKAEKNWEVAVFATNITDEFYATSGGTAEAFNQWGGDVLTPGRPREIGATVSYNFDE